MCHDYHGLPAFETLSSNLPRIETGYEPALPKREQFPKYVTVLSGPLPKCGHVICHDVGAPLVGAQGGHKENVSRLGTRQTS